MLPLSLPSSSKVDLGTNVANGLEGLRPRALFVFVGELRASLKNIGCILFCFNILTGGYYQKEVFCCCCQNSDVKSIENIDCIGDRIFKSEKKIFKCTMP